jgi:hypothetical protein
MDCSLTGLVRRVLAEGLTVIPAVERDAPIHATPVQAAKATSAAM